MADQIFIDTKEGRTQVDSSGRADSLRSEMASELERTVRYLTELASRNSRTLFWGLILFSLFSIMAAVKEITSLLLLAYVVSLLMDPLVRRLERYHLARGYAVLILSALFVLSVLTFVVVAVPSLVREYGNLVSQMPHYFKQLVISANALLESWASVKVPINPDELWDKVSQYSSMIGVEHLKRIGTALTDTVLSGYSVTLTVVNLLFFPFFLYYIASDLDIIHKTVGSLLPVHWRSKVSDVGTDILAHLYAFVRGQLTVSAILILFYMCGLMLIGLPSALIIGFLSGALSVVPYLGVFTGLCLATLVTLITNPGWWPFLKVLIVFGTVQTLEGSVLTPRIVGGSLGLHPLGVMLALVIGSQLLGLFGLVIAIPAAATIRVLIRHVFKELDATKVSDGGIIVSANS